MQVQIKFEIKMHFLNSALPHVEMPILQRTTENTLVFQQVGRTEQVQNCLSPKFAKKFVVDYYFEIVQKLQFGIYDIDNKTVDLSDDDFLGQLECTMGQVRPRSHSAPLMMHV